MPPFVFRRARVRLVGSPASSERELDFVYRPEIGRYCSDALVAVSRGRQGRQIYAAALGIPERAFAAAMTLGPDAISPFRRLPAEIIAWAARPELDWEGFGPTAERALWEPDWVQLARQDEPPRLLARPARPTYLAGAHLSRAIDDLVLDAQLREELLASAQRAGRSATDWHAGGCLVLAEGLQHAFGGEMLGIIDDPDCSCGDYDSHALEHVALRLRDGRCLDATGLHLDEAAMLEVLRRLGYRKPVSEAVTADEAERSGIHRDRALSRLIAHRLRLELR